MTSKHYTDANPPQSDSKWHAVFPPEKKVKQYFSPSKCQSARGARTFLSFILDAIEEFLSKPVEKLSGWMAKRRVPLRGVEADWDFGGEPAPYKGFVQGTPAFMV